VKRVEDGKEAGQSQKGKLKRDGKRGQERKPEADEYYKKVGTHPPPTHQQYFYTGDLSCLWQESMPISISCRSPHLQACMPRHTYSPLLEDEEHM
jgi:hypothetical protein